MYNGETIIKIQIKIAKKSFMRNSKANAIIISSQL